jgi:hypothetical protein
MLNEKKKKKTKQMRFNVKGDSIQNNKGYLKKKIKNGDFFYISITN